MIDLSSLGATEFESLCYDLLAHLGLQNLQWRKGQNEGCSSSDSGRDIEGVFVRQDIDGAVVTEKWFVECKHWAKAVPPTAIHGLITWADAERPNVAVIICSGALSNPAHDWIRDYRRENRPAYLIKEWEQKTLEALLPSFPDILLDYDIPTSYTSLLSHALWRDLKVHDLDYLFSLLDAIADAQRDRMLGNVYHSVLPLRMRQPTTGKETVGELLIDPPKYDSFKRRCTKLTNEEGMNKSFLASAIVSTVTRWLAFYADPFETARAGVRSRKAIELFEDNIRQIEAGGDFSARWGMSREEHIDTLRKCADDLRVHLAESPEGTAKSRELLDEWERRVVMPFLNEDQFHVLRNFLRETDEAQ